MIPGRLAPLLLLVAYALAFAAAALGTGVPAFDDHPGQLYRLWHAVGAGLWPPAWNAGWWGGYPELQFYPPGWFALGALLHHASGGLVPVPVAYRVLVWLTYLAPGVTAFLALARLLGSGWPALPGAFVVLTLSAGVASGVEGGVRWGMLPARLGWALLPLVLLVLGRWVSAGPAGRPPLGLVPLLAGIALVHPAHLPAAGALVLLAALAGPARGRRLAGAALAALVAGALTAAWTLPLLLRLEHARALTWGRLAPLETARDHPLLVALLLLAAAAAAGARAPADRLAAAWPWAAAAVVVLDAVATRLGAGWLPPDRAADGAWMAVMLAAGLAAGRLLRRLPRGLPRTAAALAAALAAAAAPAGAGTLTVWPRTGEWPTLAAVERGLRLDDLWAALRQAPPGRVLFVRSGVPLVYGTEWWRPHTHATALAPLRAGRDIVNGTFTHPSPVAALVYRGSPGPGPITRLVEQLDGLTLFGRPLGELDGTDLAALTDRLGVGVVVALEDDLPRLGWLDAGPAFARRGRVGPFVLWERRPPPALPVRGPGGRWTVDLAGPPGTWLGARLTYYPLWRASRGGIELPTRPGPAWDLEVRLDGAGGPVELVYGPGWPERAGLLVSAAGVMGWLAEAARRRRRGSGPA